MNIFAQGTDLDALEQKTQNQAATPGVTDFSGTLEVNGVPIIATGGPFLPLAGGTMSGDINLGSNDLVAVTSMSVPLAGNAVKIGRGTTLTSVLDGGNNVAVGNNNAIAGLQCVTIGDTVSQSVGLGRCSVVGYNSSVAGDQSHAFGSDNNVTGDSSLAFGRGNTIGANGACIFGNGATNNDAGTVIIGTVGVTDIRPNGNGLCDLGTTASSFKDVVMSGSVVGPTNSRTADDIVSNAGASVNNNVAVFSGVTGKLIADSGGSLGQYLPLAGGTMAGNIQMNGNTIDVDELTNNADIGQSWGRGATASGFPGNTAIGRFVLCTVNDAFGFGRNMTLSANQTLSVGQGCDNNGFNSQAIGSFCTIPDGQSNLAIGQSSSAGGVGTNFCIALGSTCVNTTGSSFLFGDPNVINIRANSAICDLGTSSSPFQTLYLNTSIEGTSGLAIGPTTATSLALGRSAITTTALGTFVANVAKGSWYSTTTYNPSFSAGVNRLTPPTAATAGPLVEFTHSLGVLTYTGSRTRGFRITYNITFTTGASGTNMTFFNAIAGSTTIGTQAQVRHQVNAVNNAVQENTFLTDLVTLSTGQTVELAGACAALSAAVGYNFISCSINSLLD